MHPGTLLLREEAPALSAPHPLLGGLRTLTSNGLEGPGRHSQPGCISLKAPQALDLRCSHYLKTALALCMGLRARSGSRWGSDPGERRQLLMPLTQAGVFLPRWAGTRLSTCSPFSRGLETQEREPGNPGASCHLATHPPRTCPQPSSRRPTPSLPHPRLHSGHVPTPAPRPGHSRF